MSHVVESFGVQPARAVGRPSVGTLGAAVVAMLAPPMVGAAGGAVAGFLASLHPATAGGSIFWVGAGISSGVIGGNLSRWAVAQFGRRSINDEIGVTMIAILCACGMSGLLGGIVGNALDGLAGDLWYGALGGMLIGVGTSLLAAFGLGMLMRVGLDRGHPAVVGAFAGASAALAVTYSLPTDPDGLALLGLRAFVGAAGGALGGFACQLGERGGSEGKVRSSKMRALAPLGVAVVLTAAITGFALSQSDLTKRVSLWGQVDSIDLSSDGSRALVSLTHLGGEGKPDTKDARLIDLRTSATINTIRESASGARFLQTEGRAVWSGRAWDLASGKELLQMPKSEVETMNSTGRPGGTYFGKDTLDIAEMRPLPGGKFVFIALDFEGTADNCFVALWDLERNEIVSRLLAHDAKTNALGVSSDGRHAVTSAEDQTLRTWSIDSTGTGSIRSASGATIKLPGHLVSDRIKAVGISSDGRTVVGSLHGDRDDGYAIRVWDAQTGAEKRRIAGHLNMVTDVRVLRDGKRLISGSQDGTVRIWDIESGKELRRWHARGKVEHLALSEDETNLLVATSSGIRHYAIN